MSGVKPTTVLEPTREPERNSSHPFEGLAAHNRAIATGVLWQGSLRWLAQVLAWTATIAVAHHSKALCPSQFQSHCLGLTVPSRPR